MNEDRDDLNLGDRPTGRRPAGNRPSGERPAGVRPDGYRPAGSRPAGNRPAGSRPRTDRPYSERDPERKPARRPVYEAGDRVRRTGREVYERGDRAPSARREQRTSGSYMSRSYAGRRKKKSRMKPQVKIALAILGITLVIITGLILITFAGNKKNESGPKNNPIYVADISDPPTKVPETSPAVTAEPEISTSPGADVTKEPDPETTKAADPTALPYADATKEEIKYIKGLYLLRDAAYEPYTYVDSTAKLYADAVNSAAAGLPGVKIYCSAIPLSSGITFPEHLRSEINSTDQKSACEKIGEKISSPVTYVNIFDAINEHRSEYVYYRTDHHWTGRGAYYAYAEIMKAMGKQPKPITMYTLRTYDGFYGSFYNDTKGDANAEGMLTKNPDVVEAYVSGVSTNMEITDTKDKTFAWPMLNNVSDYGKTLKYCCYIGGDYPYTKIENKNLKDGSACILVKESFGNAFAPFLADHYQYVYVVDYRYYKKSFKALVQETKAKEIIFLNNLSMTRNKALVAKFTACVKS